MVTISMRDYDRFESTYQPLPKASPLFKKHGNFPLNSQGKSLEKKGKIK